MTFLTFDGVIFDTATQSIYPDAAEFLRQAENNAIVIASGDPEAQRDRATKAFAGIARVSVMYIKDVRKGDYLKPYVDMYGLHPTLVDIDPSELAYMAETCPTFQLFEMKRDASSGDGRWSVITSCNELSHI